MYVHPKQAGYDRERAIVRGQTPGVVWFVVSHHPARVGHKKAQPNHGMFAGIMCRVDGGSGPPIEDRKKHSML